MLSQRRSDLLQKSTERNDTTSLKCINSTLSMIDDILHIDKNAPVDMLNDEVVISHYSILADADKLVMKVYITNYLRVALFQDYATSVSDAYVWQALDVYKCAALPRISDIPPQVQNLKCCNASELCELGKKVRDCATRILMNGGVLC